ncbi:hypothetical protein [Halobacillus sp. BBL2006]|uniref:hypothetical protein n=1 Tax=Halobacillus sp. BBL2006 TaxID=1543706 RepID=UPI00054389D1|nr:hypothetical protein [Halobacillus sp. BBL2006]KHE73217.1 hypothetical protein LD39_00445 [Halobacillus sp. BBL2006]
MKGDSMMTEKQWLYVNLGGVIAFSLFVLLSFGTAEAGSAHGVMILISEIVGGLTLVSSILSLLYIKSEQRFISISIVAFLIAWLIYAIGYEIGIDGETKHSWIWFFSLYIILLAGFIVIRICYKRILGLYKLLPPFLLFLNGMLFVFIIFIHIWWHLPFTG